MNARPTVVLKRTAIGFLLVVLAGSIGYWLAPSPRSPADQSHSQQTLTAISAVRVDSLAALRKISTPDKIFEFIRDELNRQISIPAIDDYSLVGVNITEIVSQARVPVLKYERADASIVVFVYNYALLDDHPTTLHVRKEILTKLEEENRFLFEQHEDHFVVLWRNRDDIYAAVTANNPHSLMTRIRPQG